MASFDFLGEQESVADKASGGGFMGLLENPNFIRTLGDLAYGLDPKGIGGALGSSASGWVAMEQAQKAQEAAMRKADEEKAGNQGLMQQILQALGGDPIGKNILTEKGDMSGLDAINITNEGITLKAPNPGMTKKKSFGTNQPLETQTNKNSYDLSPLM